MKVMTEEMLKLVLEWVELKVNMSVLCDMVDGGFHDASEKIVDRCRKKLIQFDLSMDKAFCQPEEDPKEEDIQDDITEDTSEDENEEEYIDDETESDDSDEADADEDEDDGPAH